VAAGDSTALGFAEMAATGLAQTQTPFTALGQLEQPLCEFIMPESTEYEHSTFSPFKADSPIALVPPSPTSQLPPSPMQLLDIDLIEKSLIYQDCTIEDNGGLGWAEQGWHDTFTDLFSSAF